MNADNQPIVAREGSFGDFVSNGLEHALQEMEDGSVRLSPEAMAVLDEEFGKQERPLRPHVELSFLDNNSTADCFAKFFLRRFLGALFFVVREITRVSLFVCGLDSSHSPLLCEILR